MTWWKILGAILMLYTIVAGMLVPLSPATSYIEGNKARTGTTLNMTVHGYNTHYTNVDDVRAWLRRDSAYTLCASEVKTVSDRELAVTFNIPEKVSDSLGNIDFSLIVDAQKDGYSVLPGGVSIVQQVSSAPLASDCAINGLNQRAGMTFPFRNILEESIRSLYFHVPLWFAMMLLMLISVIFSVRYLSTNDLIFSVKAAAYARVGVLFGILGLVTGAIWAKHTWGAYWNWDVKQNTAAVAVLIYMAYFVVRDSFDDLDKQARISSVYNIFAFAALIPLLFVIPRLTDSLHPGNGGNPALGSNDLDNTMRMVFYPGVIAMMLIGAWLANLLWRIEWLDWRKRL